MLKHLLPLVPEKFDTYVEPFVGGGALFFALASEGRFQKAVLADTSPFIIPTYAGVRDYPDEVITHLLFSVVAAGQDPAMAQAAYYSLRDTMNLTLRNGEFGIYPSDTISFDAATFIYLNKNCFNGLVRTNKSGEFNVSWGKFFPPRTTSDEVIRAASKALQKAELVYGNYYPEFLEPGTVIFADPPYVPVSQTANFVSYTPDGFGPDKQKALAEYLTRQAHRGVHVIATNSDTEEVRSLYGDPIFKVQEVGMTRTINIDPSKRGKVNELIIYSK